LPITAGPVAAPQRLVEKQYPPWGSIQVQRLPGTAAGHCHSPCCHWAIRQCPHIPW
jgi:hypothetical protein